jgi:hypothetical protein
MTSLRILLGFVSIDLPFNLKRMPSLILFLLIIIVYGVQNILELSNAGGLPSKAGGLPMIINYEVNPDEALRNKKNKVADERHRFPQRNRFTVFHPTTGKKSGPLNNSNQKS